MKISPQSYSHNLWVGLVGFILGGIIGAIATYLIFASGVLSIVVEQVSPGQPFIRYLFGIVLAFIGIGLGGAIDGLVCGYTLHLIDREGSKKRYLLAGAFSTGISQAILVIPILLFISLISIYNVGSPKDPASFVTLFTLIGGLFGLLNGAILSLVTLRLSFAWISWLGFISASLVGGALFGFLLWRPEWISSDTTTGLTTLLFLILPGALIYGLAGGVLGLIYGWLRNIRHKTPSKTIEPPLWQDILTITIAILVFLAEVSLINHLAQFATIYKGNITTSLDSKTEGVHWQESQMVSTDILSPNGEGLGLAVGSQILATVWSNSNGEILLVFQHSGNNDLAVSSTPIIVSKSPQVDSVHPQVIIEENGYAHLTWSENGEIWYNRCQNNSCKDPINLSRDYQTCLSDPIYAQNDWPVLALSQNNYLMIAWQAGQGMIGYTIWDTTQNPENRTQGCLSSGLTSATPRLAADPAGDFWLVLSSPSDTSGIVLLDKYHQGEWGAIQAIGEGNSGEVFIDKNDKTHIAWCGPNRKLNYLIYNGSIEIVDTLHCQNRPSIFEDPGGLIHLIYGTDQWKDNFGTTRYGRALMETIRQTEGWSDPAIVALLSTDSQQEVAGYMGGDIHLAWSDTSDGLSAIWQSIQPVYQCDKSSLSSSMQVVLDVVQNGNFHPVDYSPPFCGNHFESFIYLPKPAPEFAVLPLGEVDGFDQIADLIKSGHYEVLFSIMQWDEDKGNLSPGTRIAEAIADLYDQVNANPEAYPRGLTMKILLGNYPNLSTLEMGDQIWNVVQDLADAGLETMQDPSIGWKVEVANYKGSLPHSHTKLIVVDGKTLMAAGFNIAWDHLPKDHISGKGIDMTDLGIVLSGPVAQTGMTVFDEMWQGANQLICEDLIKKNLKWFKDTCVWESANSSHLPENMKFYLPGGTANAVAIYRSADYKESDEAFHSALASAQSSIDMIHANFTAELICAVNLVFPNVCNFNNSLPYMQSLVDAIEQNRTHVRVLVEKENMNGLENQVGIQILQEELINRGLVDHLEIRFFNGRVHTKSVLIDNQLLIIGSQNFHYSSISEGGLNEFNIVTDDPIAITIYQDMFDYYWQQGFSVDAMITNSGR